MNNTLTITDTKALELYSEILNAVDVRLGRNPKLTRQIPAAMMASVINEYKKVLEMPSCYVRKYKTSKISSMLCVEIPYIARF